MIHLISSTMYYQALNSANNCFPFLLNFPLYKGGPAEQTSYTSTRRSDAPHMEKCA